MSLEVKLAETKALLKTVRHAAMATINPDGSPHNTPYFFMYDAAFTKLYWGSSKSAQHSKNIERDGRIFVAVFDSITPHRGGLYITAGNAHEVPEDEAETALAIHNSFRRKYSKTPLTKDYYTAGSQRMYIADITKLEVYSVERDANNLIIREARTPVTANELTTNGKN